MFRHPSKMCSIVLPISYSIPTSVSRPVNFTRSRVQQGHVRHVLSEAGVDPGQATERGIEAAQ
jgi:hypothetical protein